VLQSRGCARIMPPSRYLYPAQSVVSRQQRERFPDLLRFSALRHVGRTRTNVAFQIMFLALRFKEYLVANLENNETFLTNNSQAFDIESFGKESIPQ
jgi:hypothetical protein